MHIVIISIPQYLFGVHNFELSVGALPSDQVRVARVAEKLEQKLPQLDLTAAARPAASTAAYNTTDFVCVSEEHYSRKYSTVFKVHMCRYK